jgi:hypothetical protein
MAEERQVGPGLFVKLGIDTSSIVGQVATVSLAINQSLEIFGKFEAAIQKYGGMANRLQDVSYQTGVSTDKLQQLHYAALLAGDSAEGVDSALSRLTLSMDAATDATSAQAKAFQALSVDPTGKTPDVVFIETAKALTKMDDVTRRNAIAMDLYGRGYKEILPLMETYIANQKEIEAHPIYSKQELRDLAEAKVTWDKLGDSLTIYSGKALAAYKETSSLSAAFGPLGVFASALGRSSVETGGGGIDKYSGPLSDPKYVQEMTDKYAGLSKEGLSLAIANDRIAKAEKDKAEAFKKGDIEAFDTASAALAGYKNDLTDLIATYNKVGEASQSAKKSIGAAWADSSVVGDAGSAMQLFMQQQMEAGVDYQSALNAWGSDTGAAATPTKGTLGAVKGSGKGSAPPDKAKGDTKTITTEYDKQLAALQDLTKGTQAEYIKQEDYSLTHWTALTEMMRVALTDMAQNWKKYVDFAAAFPTIHNIGIVTWTDKGPDWTPESNPVFMQSARRASLASQNLSFAASDFSGIETNASKKEKEKSGEGTTKTVSIALYQTNYGVKDNAEGTNKALGKLAALGGGLP